MIPAPAPPPPRRTDRPLPAHRFLPAHPAHRSAPGERPPDPQPHPSTLGWSPVADFAYGCDLFDHRHYWEAHEVWEAEWRLVPRGSAESNLLQGLICAAAFTIKRHQQLDDAASRLLARCEGLLGRVPVESARGVQIEALLARLRAFDRGGPWPVLP